LLDIAQLKSGLLLDPALQTELESAVTNRVECPERKGLETLRFSTREWGDFLHCWRGRFHGEYSRNLVGHRNDNGVQPDDD
jgi:hypothetical protein